MLSFRAWKDAFGRSCRRYLHLSVPDTRVWTDSVLPALLQMLCELLLLFTTVVQQCGSNVADFVITVRALASLCLFLLLRTDCFVHNSLRGAICV